MKCRHCHKPVEHIFLDLGYAPPSNAYLSQESLLRPEVHFPLKVRVCSNCWLVQTEDYATSEQLFTDDYAYFSSTSESWSHHARRFFEEIANQRNLNSNSYVIEIASNDGYLLKHFVRNQIPCLGIEPTASTAEEAEKNGIPVWREFFTENLGVRLAQENRKADLLIGNNVYAHVPNINDFTRGLKRALKPNGLITLEFPHLYSLILHNQFDTVYHEHFSYLSLTAVNAIFAECGLRIFEVKELPTHGGSLRIYGCHAEENQPLHPSVSNILLREAEQGLSRLETYEGFQDRVNTAKNDLVSFLIEKKRQGKSVVGYGAAAKGNTILNYAGIRPDLLPCIFDASPAKQFRFTPGSHIPILPAYGIEEAKPDYVLILPWNIADEVIEQNNHLRKLGTKFVTAIPEINIR